MTDPGEPGAVTGHAASREVAPLPREAYRVAADLLARRLLGCVLVVSHVGDEPLRARITETEAYLGEEDRACHANRGRTKRTESLYGPPGTAYVYLVYGMHELFNVVASEAGDPHAVLVRAVRPLNFDARTRGPGLLTRAMGIDRRHDRSDLTAGPIRIEPGPAPARVRVGPRIGVAYAKDWADAPLRFGDGDDAWVSKPFPAAAP